MYSTHFPASKWQKIAFTVLFRLWAHDDMSNTWLTSLSENLLSKYYCSLVTLFLSRFTKMIKTIHNMLFNNLSSPLCSCVMESFISTNKSKKGNDPIHEPKGCFYYSHWWTDLCWTLLGSPCLHFQHPSCPEFSGESRRIRWNVQLLLASKSCTDQQSLKMDFKMNKYMKTSTCLCVIGTK